MNRIFKYHIETTDEQIVKIPLRHGESLKNSVLKIDTQYGSPFMWVMVEDENESRECKVFVRGTGHSCDNSFTKPDTYLGSYQLYNGAFVGHVFGI